MSSKQELRRYSIGVLSALVSAAWLISPAIADDVTSERIKQADKEPHNWLSHHQDYEATRFSSLDSINAGNVKGMKLAWTFALGGIEGGHDLIFKISIQQPN